MARQVYEFDITLVPSEVGERVRFFAYGGNVRKWMADAGLTGVVTRFTSSGNPVIATDPSPTALSMTGVESLVVVDTFNCARCIAPDDKWVRPPGVPNL